MEVGEHIEAYQKAKQIEIDAERYRKLREWMIFDARLFDKSDLPGKAGIMLYGPTFDAAVDALPALVSLEDEPIEGIRTSKGYESGCDS